MLRVQGLGFTLGFRVQGFRVYFPPTEETTHFNIVSQSVGHNAMLPTLTIAKIALEQQNREFY